MSRRPSRSVLLECDDPGDTKPRTPHARTHTPLRTRIEHKRKRKRKANAAADADAVRTGCGVLERKAEVSGASKQAENRKIEDGKWEDGEWDA
ncbi:hypothetical protein PLEOSDRAFT_1109171 [Pleurotus ostreatus PC15]|uniref:Uncharacterized protein n=1 Tax=Pleurotus ostreatus (strain PC15) TaxID=1137138 RepID=A0A067N4Z0_PLEO1|nr:hypothetical protein PLEOSDRAFT_1109171 [Pleurotus ostreatus PC15]